MRNRHAFSLIELTLTLALCATLIAVATPLLNHGRGVLSVRAAGAELAGLIALTRTTAIGTGGATLLLDLADGTAVIETPDGTPLSDVHAIAARHGVSIETDRASPLRIRYDALGIGRLASASIRVRRGNVRTTLTISSYGRVRQ